MNRSPFLQCRFNVQNCALTFCCGFFFIRLHQVRSIRMGFFVAFIRIEIMTTHHFMLVFIIIIVLRSVEFFFGLLYAEIFLYFHCFRIIFVVAGEFANLSALIWFGLYYVVIIVVFAVAFYAIGICSSQMCNVTMIFLHKTTQELSL